MLPWIADRTRPVFGSCQFWYVSLWTVPNSILYQSKSLMTPINKHGQGKSLLTFDYSPHLKARLMPMLSGCGMAGVLLLRQEDGGGKSFWYWDNISASWFPSHMSACSSASRCLLLALPVCLEDNGWEWRVSCREFWALGTKMQPFPLSRGRAVLKQKASREVVSILAGVSG